MKTYPESRLTDLLIEFDEMGFAPTTVCENPEQYAIDWRERVRKEFTRLTDENDNLTVELEVAQRDVENLTRTLEEATDEIKALEAENSELRATLSKLETVEKELTDRLKEAVILPCKVGDTVYWLSDTMIYEYKVQGFIFDTNDLFGLRLILGEIEPSVMYCKDKKLFFDRAEAEARLKEMKENNNG